MAERNNKDKYYDHLPVAACGNAYFNGAKPMSGEPGAYVDTEHEVYLGLAENADGIRLETDLYDFLPENINATVSTATLGYAFEPEQLFEAPDGTEIIFNEDYFGDHRAVNPVCGPFEGKAQSLKPLF